MFREGSIPRFPPRAMGDDVLDAVKNKMRREYRNAIKNVAMNTSAAFVTTEE